MTREKPSNLLRPENPSQVDSLESLLCYLMLRYPSGLFLIEGLPRNGKTNGAMYWAEVLHQNQIIKSGMMATNVYMLEGEQSFLGHIVSLDQLQNWVTLNKPHKKVYLLDEAGKSFPRRTPMSKDNIDILREIQTLGHFNLFIILITQNAERLLDSGLLDQTFLAGRLRKPLYKKPKYWEYSDSYENVLNSRGHDFPRTSIPYDPNHVAMFTRHATGYQLITNNPHYEKYRVHRQEGKSLASVGLHTEQARRIRKTIEDWAFEMIVKGVFTPPPKEGVDHESQNQAQRDITPPSGDN